jgi:hypothetical protein
MDLPKTSRSSEYYRLRLNSRATFAKGTRSYIRVWHSPLSPVTALLSDRALPMA